MLIDNDPKPSSPEELIGTLAIQLDVLTLLLIQKGIIRKEEMLEILRKVQENEDQTGENKTQNREN